MPSRRGSHGSCAQRGVPEPYRLVGHSMGAAVALTLAAHEPDAVSGVVLVSPAGLRPIPSAAAAALGVAAALYIPLRRQAAPLAAWPWGRRLLMAGGVVDGAALDPALVRRLVGASRGARRTGPALSAVASADLRDLLARLPLPVGAVWGRGDRVIPPGGAHTLDGCAPARRARSSTARVTSRWSSNRMRSSTRSSGCSSPSPECHDRRRRRPLRPAA